MNWYKSYEGAKNTTDKLNRKFVRNERFKFWAPFLLSVIALALAAYSVWLQKQTLPIQPEKTTQQTIKQCT